MSTTRERRELIRSLLAESEVKSQVELQRLLERRGVETSQPVLSRDLRALNVAKQSGSYQLVLDERVTPLAALQSLLRSASEAKHFVLVACEPGAASAVARALEAEGLEGLVGTLAGDDTVLVVVETPAAGRRVRRRVRDLLE